MNLIRSLRNPDSPVGLYFGWIVWSFAFVALYGTQGLGCSLGWTEMQFVSLNFLTLALTGLWLAHLALLSWLTLHAWRGARPAEHDASDMKGFVRAGNRISQVSATAATALLGFPILLLHPCT